MTMPPEKTEKVQEYTEDYQKLISPYWVIFIFIVVFWGIACLLSPQVAYFSARLFELIFSNWESAGAFMSLVFMTVGWAFLELFFRIILYFRLSYPNLSAFSVRATRFVVMVLFAFIVAFRYISIWDYDEIPLYIIAGGLTAFISILYLRSQHFKARVLASIEFYKKQKTRKDFYEYFYLKVEKIILIALFSGMVFIFLWLNAYSDVAWIKEFTTSLGEQLLTNPFMLVLFIFVIMMTFFMPLLKLLSDLLPAFALDILSYQTKKRIKKIRFWTLIFLVILVVMRLIPQWEIPDWIKNVLAVAGSISIYIVSRLISLYGIKNIKG
jgi:hypothetical protein